MSIRSATAIAFLTVIGAERANSETLWQPDVFDAAYVAIIDDATNGCWTNIRKVKEYAEDQLQISGFKVQEQPQARADLPHPVLRSNVVAFQLHASVSRQPNGECRGLISSTFLAAVAPNFDQSKLIVTPIGQSRNTVIYRVDAINVPMFDHVKSAIQSWIDSGAVKTRGD